MIIIKFMLMQSELMKRCNKKKKIVNDWNIKLMQPPKKQTKVRKSENMSNIQLIGVS